MRPARKNILATAICIGWLAPQSEAGFPVSDRYEAWIQDHAFPIGAWYTGENPSPGLTQAQRIDRYRNAGYTRLATDWTLPGRADAAYAGSNGMDFTAIITNPSQQNLQDWVAGAMAIGDGASAIMVFDEPNNSEIGLVADRIHWVQQNYQVGVPHADAPLVYANLSALGINIDTYINQADPDVLSYDRYPHHLDGTDDPNYFAEMNLVRSKSLQYNIPMWMFQQAISRTDASQGQTYRLPSESDIRFQAFSFLAHGGQGIDHFMFLSESFPQAVITHAGNQPSSVYHAIAAMSPEILALGRTLQRIRSVGNVEFLGGALTSFDDVQPFVSSGSREIYNIEGAESALVSHFLDEDGGEYFMLVNLTHGADLDKAVTQDSMTLFFDPSILSVQRINRLTGEPERLATINNPRGGNRYLTITLEGGTGDLFRYNNGFFPGIQAGDTDVDGDVDLADLSSLASHYGGNSSGHWGYGDFDLDGDVDLADLSLLAGNYGAGEAAAFADFQLIQIPEPSSLCALVLLAFCCSRNVLPHVAENTQINSRHSDVRNDIPVSEPLKGKGLTCLLA